MVRKAVSVLLTRDLDSSEIYLVERNPELRFFGGYFAFPGGTLDTEDEKIPVADLSQNENELPDDYPLFIAAAVREVFEETGALLTRGEKEIAQDDLNAYRQKLLANDIEFSELLQREGHHISVKDFIPICQITTPPFAPVRYATQFVIARIPDHATPAIWQGELMRGGFYSARKALDLWRKGEILLVPPIIIMLQELIDRSVRTFIQSIQQLADGYRNGKFHEVYFSPGVLLVPMQTKTLPPAAHTNTYLVGESQIYIIDPASADPTERQRLWNFLDRLVAAGIQLKGILLTHQHPDHVGAVSVCQERYGLPVFAHKETAQRMPNIEFAGFLNHGDELELGDSPDGQPDWNLKVYHTPGHAVGHLCFQEDRYHACVVGDMISTVSTIVIDPPEGHMATYIESLEFLETIATGTLYPGHGPAMPDGRAVTRYYIEHRKEREQKTLECLSAVPQPLSKLVEKVYDDVDRIIWPLAERSLLAGLIKLIEDGKCEQIGDEYRNK